MDGRPAICHVRTRDGVRIAYHCLGSGPPLVLLFPYHVNDLVRNWMVPPHRQGMRFLANELTVINLDLRGAGQSAAEVDDLSLDGFCTDIQAVLEDVGVERAAVCALGNSIPIAAQLARTCPDMVSRLVLIEAGESETSMRLFALRILNPGMGADLRASAVAGLTDPDTSAALSDVMRHAVSPRNFVRYVELYERAAPADPLAGVATSTLLVHAADDELIPVSVGREIAARGSDAHLMVLPGSSGLVMWEESALDRIVSFASGAWSGDPGEVASTRPLGRRGRGKASGGGPDGPGTSRAAARRDGPDEPRDRRRALHQLEHRVASPPGDLRQDVFGEPDRGRRIRTPPRSHPLTRGSVSRRPHIHAMRPPAARVHTGAISQGGEHGSH